MFENIKLDWSFVLFWVFTAGIGISLYLFGKYLEYANEVSLDREKGEFDK